MCGSPFFSEIFKSLGCQVEWKISEGTYIEVKKGERKEVAFVKGEARKILAGERTALNLLARASGIASHVRTVTNIVQKAHWKVDFIFLKKNN